MIASPNIRKNPIQSSEIRAASGRYPLCDRKLPPPQNPGAPLPGRHTARACERTTSPHSRAYSCSLGRKDLIHAFGLTLTLKLLVADFSSHPGALWLYSKCVSTTLRFRLPRYHLKAFMQPVLDSYGNRPGRNFFSKHSSDRNGKT